MKCKSCINAKKGYFPSAPNDYVCIGVKEPFIIKNIDEECTEYPEYRETVTIQPRRSESYVGRSCLICGDSVSTNLYDDRAVCDKCKSAVMSLRRLLEYLEEESNEDT